MARALASSAFARPRPVERLESPQDQAAGLRHLLGGAVPQPFSRGKPQPRLRVLAVTGSTEQSGTSAIVARLAQHAAGTDRVLVLDQTANEVAHHAGVTARHDLFDLVSGRLAFDAVAVPSGNWRLLPARRGLRKLAEAGTKEEELFCTFLRLRDPVSLLLVNLDDQTRAPLPVGASGGEVLLITTPGQAAITAAYARIKALGRDAARSAGGVSRTLCPAATPCMPGTPDTIRVLVNGASHYADARRVFRVLADTARNFLDIEPVYAGFLPPDRSGAPFGTTRHAPPPACTAALARLAAAARSWRLAEYTLPETSGLE